MFIFWACQNHLRISFVSLFYSFVGALAGRSVSWGCVIRRCVSRGRVSRGRVSRGRVSRGRVSRGFVRGHPLRGAVCQHPVLGQILSWEPGQVGWRNLKQTEEKAKVVATVWGMELIKFRFRFSTRMIWRKGWTTFLKIILAAKLLMRHSSRSPKQPRRPLPSFLSVSSSMVGWTWYVICIIIMVWWIRFHFGAGSIDLTWTTVLSF